jgi:hypothetical protein
MAMKTTSLALLALAAGAFAQGPPPGRGRGPFGPNNGPRFLGGEPGRPGRTVKNAPYMGDLVTEVTQSLPDGNHIHQTTTAHMARDSEGRTRREQSLTGLGPLGAGAASGNAVFITDPVAGVSFALNPNAKTATRESFSRMRGPGGPGGPPPMDGRGMRPPGRKSGSDNVQNLKTESLGRQTIEGVQAEGTRTTMTIPAGAMGNDLPIQVVTERWYSPDLQLAVLTKHSDPRSGDTVTKLINISRTEPSRTLFEPPSDYKTTEGAQPRKPVIN